MIQIPFIVLLIVAAVCLLGGFILGAAWILNQIEDESEDEDKDDGKAN